MSLIVERNKSKSRYKYVFTCFISNTKRDEML